MPTPHEAQLSPISFSNGQKSISDDDLCSRCSHCDYHPGALSSCKEQFPGLEDADGYVQSCESAELSGAGIKVHTAV